MLTTLSPRSVIVPSHHFVMSIIIAEYLHHTFYFPHRLSYNIPSIRIGITTKVATGTPMEYKWFPYPRIPFCDQGPYCRPPTSPFLARSWTPACIQTPLNCPISCAHSPPRRWVFLAHSPWLEHAKELSMLPPPMPLIRVSDIQCPPPAQILHSRPFPSPRAGYRDFIS